MSTCGAGAIGAEGTGGGASVCTAPLVRRLKWDLGPDRKQEPRATGEQEAAGPGARGPWRSASVTGRNETCAPFSKHPCVASGMGLVLSCPCGPARCTAQAGHLPPRRDARPPPAPRGHGTRFQVCSRPRVCLFPWPTRPRAPHCSPRFSFLLAPSFCRINFIVRLSSSPQTRWSMRRGGDAYELTLEKLMSPRAAPSLRCGNLRAGASRRLGRRRPFVRVPVPALSGLGRVCVLSNLLC